MFAANVFGCALCLFMHRAFPSYLFWIVVRFFELASFQTLQHVSLNGNVLVMCAQYTQTHVFGKKKDILVRGSRISTCKN